MDREARGVAEGVHSPEDEICLLVPAPPVPPAFDDAVVVSVDDNMSRFGTQRDDDTDKEFEAHGFGPQNFSALGLPSGDEAPGAPLRADDHSDPDTGAGIRERVDIEDLYPKVSNLRIKFLLARINDLACNWNGSGNIWPG